MMLCVAWHGKARFFMLDYNVLDEIVARVFKDYMAFTDRRDVWIQFGMLNVRIAEVFERDHEFIIKFNHTKQSFDLHKPNSIEDARAWVDEVLEEIPNNLRSKVITIRNGKLKVEMDEVNVISKLMGTMKEL